MQILFVLFGILALVSFTRIADNYDDGMFWFGQIVRIVLGLVWGVIGVHFFLVPCTTIPMWLMYWGWLIIICHGIDFFAKFDYDENVVIDSIIVGAMVLMYIGMGVFALSQTKAQYSFAKEYVTVIESAVPETATENIGIVSEKTAHRLANPKIAEFGNSSKYTLGTYTKQSINGTLVWVTPVEYASTMRANGSTPGYLVVDAFDTSKDVEIVDGNKFNYMPSAIWSKDLRRHVRKELPRKLLFDAMLQIDNEGTAYWVVPYGHYKSFVCLPVVDGVAVVNPTNGAIDCYAVSEAPEWIDAIIPGDIAEKYGNWYGQNKHGWWAKAFAPTDQFQLTRWEGDDAWSIVYDETGDMWYTTDTTTMNADKSMVGYMMINARTCEIKYFPNVSGLNGKGISENFIQLYKEKTGWSPVEPTLYNIYGTLTWFSTMVDENGAIQAYCLGDTKGNVVGETTMDSALSAYKRLLTTVSLGTTDPTENSELKTIEGTVKRVIIVNNLTKILLETNQIFVIEETVSNIAQFTQLGDAVKISYLDTQEDEYYVVEFVNSTLE